MKLRRRLVLGSALGLAGCGLAGGLAERPYAERREWPLLAVRPVSLPARPHGKTLLLRTLRAGPGAQSRGLQTIQPDGSVQTAFYEEWAVTPAAAVEQSLRGWLEASGLYAAVLSPGSRAEADLVLDGELEALAADAGRDVALASLSLVLTAQRGMATRVLLQAALHGQQTLAAGNPPAQVAAMTRAVAAVCMQAEARLAAFA